MELSFRRDVYKRQGQRIVGCAVLVQIPGNLVEVAANPAVLGGQLPDSGEQFVIDRRHMDNGAYGGAPVSYTHLDVYKRQLHEGFKGLQLTGCHVAHFVFSPFLAAPPSSARGRFCLLYTSRCV